MAEINPIRYRGYYYDSDTELYYLQSRYYDPEICRFISEDIYTTTDLNGILSSNMFAYCENSPIKNKDPNGEFVLPDFAITALVGGVVGGVMGAMSAVATGGNVLKGALLGFGSGAITGALGTIKK